MKNFQSARRAVLILFGLSQLWITGALAETSLERGTYLVRGIAACGNCHTPKGPEGDLPGMELAGMTLKDSEGQVIYQFPNITPDRETGVGGWTDEQLAVAIREGIRPDHMGEWTTPTISVLAVGFFPVPRARASLPTSHKPG